MWYIYIVLMVGYVLFFRAVGFSFLESCLCRLYIDIRAVYLYIYIYIDLLSVAVLIS